ncbi:MAG: MgtC/SapB family protein [Anaerolineales bacterium]|nr:MgtC/SapB family protein [Anaerolineales bacterium]
MFQEPQLFFRLFAALAMGFLIGLQREHSHGGPGREILAGERTFALIGASGFLAALMSDQFGQPLIYFAAIAFVAALTAIGYFTEATQKGRVGITSEVSVLLAMLLGGLSYWNYLGLAVAAAIGATLLLSLKIETDKFVAALTREDILAALQFAAVTAIVLPILPNTPLGPPPLDVLNPFNIWLMVVFISGISFLGYVLIKLLGADHGIRITGFLGGLVSSTAVTLSFAQRSIKLPKLAKPFALAILVAWTMMFARVMVEVAVVNRDLLRVVWPPVVASGLAGLGYAVFLMLAKRRSDQDAVHFSNPFDLLSALRFGLLYAAVLLMARSAQVYLGDTGVLLAGFLSGLADVDAITLSLAELARSGGLSLDLAAKALVNAVMANTLVKGGMVLLAGSASLRRAVLPGLVLILVVGLGTAYWLL